MAKDKFEKDTWLYGTAAQREVIKAEIKEKKGDRVEPASSDATLQFLTEAPRDRAARERNERTSDRATITNWGGRRSSTVSAVSKAKGPGKPTTESGAPNEPPVSRQLRDPFTTFYVQGIALEPPLPPERLLNLTEENALHSACLMAKATDACGRGWSFEPKDGKKAAPLSQKPAPEPGAEDDPNADPDADPSDTQDKKPQPAGPIGQPAPGVPGALPVPGQPSMPGQQPKPGQPLLPGQPRPGAFPPDPDAPKKPGEPGAAPKKPEDETIYSDLPIQLKQAMEDLTPDLTFTELLYQAAWEMDAIGWSAWEVVRIDNDGTPGIHGKIAAIYPIPAHTLRASLDPRKWVQIRAGRVRYFKKFGAECTINNETGAVLDWNDSKTSKPADKMPEDYVASELIIFKTYTPRSLWYGLPRWISSIATIAELSAIREFNVSWFASGGQVDYHLHFKAGSIDEATSMKTDVEQQVREFAGRGHTNLFTAGGPDSEVTANKLGDMLREGHFRFRRTDLIKEVLIAHNVPPYRIGWAETGSLGGNAAPEMLGAYKAGAIQPIQQVIEDRLRVTLFDPEIGIKTDEFRFKLKEMEDQNEDQELAKATSGTEGGYMTPNQARTAIGLEPDANDPALDKYYYKGQPLGTPPPAPASPFGGGPKNPDGSHGLFGKPEDGSDDGSGGESQGPTPPGGFPPKPGFKSKAASEARAVVIEMLRGYEKTQKAALEDNDPIDSEQPPVQKPKRGRGRPSVVTSGGPARDDKPNVS